MKKTRRFHLERNEDFSGISGTGIVAYGIEFQDGSAAMRWDTDTASTVIFDTIEQIEIIHGHEGRTRIVFDDE